MSVRDLVRDVWLIGVRGWAIYVYHATAHDGSDLIVDDLPGMTTISVPFLAVLTIARVGCLGRTYAHSVHVRSCT